LDPARHRCNAGGGGGDDWRAVDGTTYLRQDINIILLLAAWTPAATVYDGTLVPFHGSHELDLLGSFLYALDVGGGGGQNVLGVGFKASSTTAGVSVTAQNTADPWQTPPDLSGTDDASLEDVLHSIRWSNVGDAVPDDVRVDLDVQTGQAYKLQLLFSENYWGVASHTSKRYMDVEIEGVLVVDELEPQAAAGTPPRDAGAVYTYTLAASDDTLNVRIAAGTGGSGRDPNPLLSGLTVEIVPGPATLGLLGLGVALLLRVRRGGRV
jgi:hypothetical protein